jgi:formylglycine-generating enzyme required for sulfatase activity
MLRRLLAVTTLLVLSYPLVSAGADLYVLAAVERSATVSQQEADGFYLVLTGKLAETPDIKLVERSQLEQVLGERDLMLALTPQDADKVYAASAGKLTAKNVLVPALCKVENDFLLSLRLVDVNSGLTKRYTMRKQRVVPKFAAEAGSLVDGVLGPAKAPSAVPSEGTAPSGEEVAGIVDVKYLKDQCRLAKAAELFPALWDRCEKISRNPKADANWLAEYYMGLLQLCARANNPPAGMVFIPAGYVSLDTSAGKRSLWVEAFFIDRCETSVLQYDRFLQQAKSSGAGSALPKGFKPITSGDASFNQPDLPVVGISFEAAATFASRYGKVLPTQLQWLRAARGDTDRAYPCGDLLSAGRCNLTGGDDGFATLAPCNKPGDDVSPYGVLGMTGNVREWTSSWFSREAYARCLADAPEEVSDGTLKVVMGSSWRLPAERAAFKNSDKCKPGEAMDDLGFRCAMGLKLLTSQAEDQQATSTTPPVNLTDERGTQ